MSACSDFTRIFSANKLIFSQLKIVLTRFLKIRLKLQGSTHLKTLILILIFLLYKQDFMATLGKIRNTGIKSMIFIRLERQPYKV